MSADSFTELSRHYAHAVVVARYTDNAGEVLNVAVECVDCSEVLFDYEKEEE